MDIFHLYHIFFKIISELDFNETETSEDYICILKVQIVKYLHKSEVQVTQLKSTLPENIRNHNGASFKQSQQFVLQTFRFLPVICTAIFFPILYPLSTAQDNI